MVRANKKVPEAKLIPTKASFRLSGKNRASVDDRNKQEKRSDCQTDFGDEQFSGDGGFAADGIGTGPE